ncbi:hypothetical protein [Segniliparus rugosus]|uniref:hypothetical protein n=1 Tax=Segniliparus rugosus TaxID=286804 RepID=UPI0012EC09E0|nr:hypothetical protein [Segniliparus rugosus]
MDDQAGGEFDESLAYFVERASRDWIPISVLYHDVASIQRERGLARGLRESMALGECLLEQLFERGVVVGDLVEDEGGWRFEVWRRGRSAWLKKIRAWLVTSGGTPLLGELGWLTSRDMAASGAVPDGGFCKLDEQEKAEVERRERAEGELFVRRLGEFEPAVQALIDEEAEQGDGYPMGTYLILADVARWVMAEIGTEPARRLLERIEQDFRDGTDAVRGLIALGFVESSAFAGEAAEAALAPQMGPILLELVRVTNERGMIFGPQIDRVIDKFGLG